MTDMFSPGATLRAAREKSKLTQHDVAEATRMKVHVIAAIENNDFSGIAAPLYGKGFIKLYAECVGLDPAPLIRDYMERHARVVQPTLRSDKPPAPTTESGLPGPSTLDRFRSSGAAGWDRVLAGVSDALREAADTLVEGWNRWRIPVARSQTGQRYSRGLGGPAAFPAWGYAAIGVGVILLIFLITTAIGHLRQRPAPVASRPAPAATRSSGVHPLRLVEEPRPTYIRTRTP